MYKEGKIVSAVAFLVFAIAGAAALSFKSTSKVFPLTVCILGMLCCVMEFMQVSAKQKKSKPSFQAKKLEPAMRKKIFIMFVMTLAYMICIKAIGWAVSTLAYMLAVSLYMGVPGMSRRKIVMICVLVSAVYFLIFKTFMNINMPKGILI